MEFLLIGGIIAVVVVGVALKAAGGSQASPDARAGKGAPSFKKTPLLNKSETRLLGILDEVAPKLFGKSARVYAQVSYGEIIKGTPSATHSTINSKRADFVIVGDDQMAICIVEYQGAGHYGRNDAQRARAEASDKIKRAAAAEAGILFAEIPPSFDAKSVRSVIARAAR